MALRAFLSTATRRSFSASAVRSSAIPQRIFCAPSPHPARSFGTHAVGPRPKEYGGFRAPHVAKWHRVSGEVMATVMWLWIFWRAKHDLKALLGFEHPWDHGGGHGHGGHEDALGWTIDGVGQKPRLLTGEGGEH